VTETNEQINWQEEVIQGAVNQVVRESEAVRQRAIDKMQNDLAAGEEYNRRKKRAVEMVSEHESLVNRQMELATSGINTAASQEEYYEVEEKVDAIQREMGDNNLWLQKFEAGRGGG